MEHRAEAAARRVVDRAQRLGDAARALGVDAEHADGAELEQHREVGEREAALVRHQRDGDGALHARHAEPVVGAHRLLGAVDAEGRDRLRSRAPPRPACRPGCSRRAGARRRRAPRARAATIARGPPRRRVPSFRRKVCVPPFWKASASSTIERGVAERDQRRERQRVGAAAAHEVAAPGARRRGPSGRSRRCRAGPSRPRCAPRSRPCARAAARRRRGSRRARSARARAATASITWAGETPVSGSHTKASPTPCEPSSAVRRAITKSPPVQGSSAGIAMPRPPARARHRLAHRRAKRHVERKQLDALDGRPLEHEAKDTLERGHFRKGSGLEL